MRTKHRIFDVDVGLEILGREVLLVMSFHFGVYIV